MADVIRSKKYPPELESLLPLLVGKYKLSSRETDVLAELIAGYKTPVIAKKLFITPRTVKYHISNIYKKMNISSREELNRYINSEQCKRII